MSAGVFSWSVGLFIRSWACLKKIGKSVPLNNASQSEVAKEYLAGPTFANLCLQLKQNSGRVETEGSTASSLRLCADAGVFRWFLPTQFGGWDWDDQQLTCGYLQLAKACLATTFVITQRVAATKRIVASEYDALKQRLLPALADHQAMASVGISHLTTSRQHQGQPTLRAVATADGWTFDGYSPWVTAGPLCDWLIVGATADDGTQVLAAVDTKLPGVEIQDSFRLVALSASQTGAVHFHDVRVDQSCVLAGPVANVLKVASPGATGGLQTSTLAIGLASAAVDFISEQSIQRQNILGVKDDLFQQVSELESELMLAIDGQSTLDLQTLRTRANSIVLRATQAALIVAKGAGYVESHCCGRWCREALFFLVWSCPPEVQMNNLCELSFTQT